MGAISSASTITATAYLTEAGRQYLFQNDNYPRFVSLSDGTKIDRLKIERFSLGDPDVNYTLPYNLQSGDIPDLSGANDTTITGAKGRVLNHLISPSSATLGTGSDILEYITHQDIITIDLNKDLSKIPTVITQGLITLLNNTPTLESFYSVFPKNLGDNQIKDNKLTVTLVDPTPSTPGYRMVIFYPSTEDNHDIVTIQFEKSTVDTMLQKDFQSQVAIADVADIQSII